jgi:AMP nucleosidase
MVTEQFTQMHLEIGIEALREIIDNRESVKHLRFI